MREIHEADALELALREGSLRDCVVQGVDLHGARLGDTDVRGALFLGCGLDPAAMAQVVDRGALVFPRLPDLPYNPYRGALYTTEELFEAFDPSQPCSYCDCADARIYRHWREGGGAAPTSILETLARRLHDHAITDALDEVLRGERVVAIMGGHSMARGRGAYLDVARISRSLTLQGYVMASGGGPGAMEATHLGAAFAERTDEELTQAVDLLARAPKYNHREWLAAAMEVRTRYPDEARRLSVGIPTWFYGHEPPNVFATHIAKYFANSVREEGLVTIATHGIIFAPGKAGTVQEVFQDAAQNHYGTVDQHISPMALFGVDYWTERYPVEPLLRKLSEGRPYAEYVTISDDPDALVRFVVEHPPKKVEGGWSYCEEFCAG